MSTTTTTSTISTTIPTKTKELKAFEMRKGFFKASGDKGVLRDERSERKTWAEHLGRSSGMDRLGQSIPLDQRQEQLQSTALPAQWSTARVAGGGGRGVVGPGSTSSCGGRPPAPSLSLNPQNQPPLGPIGTVLPSSSSFAPDTTPRTNNNNIAADTTTSVSRIISVPPTNAGMVAPSSAAAYPQQQPPLTTSMATTRKRDASTISTTPPYLVDQFAMDVDEPERMIMAASYPHGGDNVAVVTNTSGTIWSSNTISSSNMSTDSTTPTHASPSSIDPLWFSRVQQQQHKQPQVPIIQLKPPLVGQAPQSLHAPPQQQQQQPIAAPGGQQPHKIPPPIKQAAVPKAALYTWCNRPPLRLALGENNYVTWDNRARPHEIRYTSVFIHPRTGECFPSRPYGSDKYYQSTPPSHPLVQPPQESTAMTATPIVWYKSKKYAEHGAAAHAYDCLTYRAYKAGGSFYEQIGNDSPHEDPIPFIPPANITPEVLDTIQMAIANATNPIERPIILPEQQPLPRSQPRIPDRHPRHDSDAAARKQPPEQQQQPTRGYAFD